MNRHINAQKGLKSCALTAHCYFGENMVLRSRGYGVQGGLSHITLYLSGLFIYWFNQQGNLLMYYLGILNLNTEAVKPKA